MNHRDNNLVVGMGELLWDLLPEERKIGGAPANFAYHISQFGLAGCVVSAIGDDALGREILEDFNAKGLEHLIETVDFPTGTVRIELDSNGIPHYEIMECVAWDHIPFTSRIEALAKRTRAVCFGSLAQRNPVSGSTIRSFLDAMPAGNDTLIVFDANLRQNFYSRETLCESMERCNILKINDEELEVICNMLDMTGPDIKKKCRELAESYDLEILILTCGVEGSYVFTRESTSFQPTPIVEVADTVGAGDSFTAAFIAALLKGKSTLEAHALAVKTSAFVCTQKGATPKLPEEITGTGA